MRRQARQVPSRSERTVGSFFALPKEKHSVLRGRRPGPFEVAFPRGGQLHRSCPPCFQRCEGDLQGKRDRFMPSSCTLHFADMYDSRPSRPPFQGRSHHICGWSWHVPGTPPSRPTASVLQVLGDRTAEALRGSLKAHSEILRTPFQHSACLHHPASENCDVASRCLVRTKLL